MKTRVAVVLLYFGNGGAENMISRLVSNLDLDKLSVKVFCIYGAPMKNRLEKAVTDHGVEICFIGKGKGFSLKSMIRLNKELTAFSPDVLHTHLSACVYCGSWILTHKKCVMLHTVHNMPVYELIRPKQLVMKLLYRTDNVVPVAISHEIKKQMGEFYKLKNPAELVYNPVDVERFSSVEKKAHDNFVIVTAGRLSAQKNQKALIEAYALFEKQVPASELYILGDGELRGELEALVADKGLGSKVHFEGNVSNVPEYFAGADVFSLSSRYEGLPLVLLEAMAAGLPIVSTDVGGVKDIVFDNGILLPYSEGEELTRKLSEALLSLYGSKEKRAEYARAGSVRVQKFDSSVIAGEYEALYQKYHLRTMN